MPEEPRSDETLVIAARNGDPESFSELMTRHKTGITSYLYRRIGDRTWAEDLGQEVFLRVYRKIGDFKADAKFTTWLYRIAHNLSVDFLKRRRLEPRLGVMGGAASESGSLRIEAPGSTPEEAAVRQELTGKVIETIESLGNKYRDVFVLCALQGLSYEEAGEVLGLSVKTVSSRLCRARKQFKARMTPWMGAVNV